MTPGQGVALAHQRAVVTLLDGRTGRLIYWPPGHGCGRKGARPKVQLPSGAVLAVHTWEVQCSPSTSDA
jgi:hypothetical protein